jgi:3-oxoacyl-(acyl-carrier-protein) synthase
MTKVFVTGFGAISSIGSTLEEHRYALQNGIAGIRKANYFKSNYKESLLFGEVGFSDEALRNLTNSVHEKEFTRTTLLSLFAFNQAIQHAKLTFDEIESERTAFISGSTVGGMCYTDELYADANIKGIASDFVESYEGSDHLLRIVKRYKIKGYTDTINTACSSSANAFYLGARLIQAGIADRVIVGGADSLAKYTVNGFNSLMILSDEACQPFDQNRNGLTLGEGAAYAVLESEHICADKYRYAELTGFGNANDAFHPSTTSDDARGPVMAMERALKKANMQAVEIDYINAHGTGTQNNDYTEIVALKKVFEKVPPYNSTKSYTGHTLAASGALEAVFSLLSMENDELYPSLRCSTPIEELNTPPIVAYQKAELKNVLSNSFGFGGNCTSLIFSKCF